MLDLPGEDVGLFDLYFAERPTGTALPGQTAAGFVCGILSTFDKACKLCEAAVAVSGKDYSIASRVLEKALELAEKSPDPLYSHFGASFLPSVYAVLEYGIKMHYENREMYPGALDKAIEFCEKQIARAPKAAEAFRHEVPGCDLPKHLGFEQLAIILEKQGRLDETIALCEQAKRQGWKSDWDKRIARCSRKKEKPSKSSTGVPSPSPSPESRTHMEYACPHCGNVLRIPLQYAGMTGSCKKCGARITVPLK
jgi:tetratricopeptide (TPR) repeat protein